MDVYMSDKEQMQKFKDWWKKYGNLILICVIVFLGANFGWRYWKHYKAQRAAQGSVLYEQMLMADSSNKISDFTLFANRLKNDYKSSPYASLASLLLAREAANSGHLDDAKKNLQWAIDHANSTSIRQIARIRLARVLLASKQFNQALQILQKVENKDYQIMIDEVNGDIYLAMNKKDQAVKFYQQALSASKNPTISAIVQMKLNLLSK